MQLFDFIKVLFEDKEQYEDLSKYDKSRQFFLLNRFMSIQYPQQANAFNHVRIPQAEVTDFWQRNMTNVYKKVPDWIFAKGQKKSTKEKSVKLPGKEATRAYLSAVHMTQRDLDDAAKILGDSVYDPIRRLEKAMEQ